MNNEFEQRSRRKPDKKSKTGRYMDDVFAPGGGQGTEDLSAGKGQAVRRRMDSQPRIDSQSRGRDSAAGRLTAGSVEPGSRADRIGESRAQSAAGTGGSRGGGSRQNTAGGNGGRPMPPQEPRASSSRAAAKAAKARKRRRLIALAIAECVALVFIFSYAYVARRLSVIQRPDFKEKNVQNIELTPAKKEHMKGYWTIAVFGVDSRGNNVGKGTNADVCMVCNINMDTGEIKLVSVFRDTYLNINDKNMYNKLNQAYAQGGPEQAVRALNNNLDLNITDYVTFNWKAVADAINILGGVDVDISQAEFHYINSFITETVKSTKIGSNQLKKAGSNHLDGVQAVAYGRLRLMDTDYARTERQRKIVSLAFEKAKKADYSVLNNILVVCLEQVATNLDFKDLTNVALSISKYHLGENGGFPWARGSMIMGKKGDCVIPQTLESNVVKLHKFLFDKDNYEPTDMVKKISAKIAADSGMYKAGVEVDHVPTDGGFIPKATTAKATGGDESEGSDESADESDESGDESNATRPGGDASGWEEWPTDAEGNPYDPALGDPTGATRPTGVTRPGAGETRPGETKPGETKPSETRPTSPGIVRPGESETQESQEFPGGPMETKPSETLNGKPDVTESPDDHTGPGAQQTTAAPGNTEKPEPTETTAANPGGTVPTVAPPPGNNGGASSDTPGGLDSGMQNEPGN